MRTRRIQKPTLWLFVFLAALPLFSRPAAAVTIPLVLTTGPLLDGTQTFSADLTGIGLTEIGLISVVDDETPVGGASGIFSGFDLDAIFIDQDGSLATAGDRYFASSFAFLAGTTRPTRGDPAFEPSAAHPGPTFGSLDATTIDVATARLDAFDAISFANVESSDGFLTLGDGGTLDATFEPPVPVGATLFLLVGEVGGQAGEGLGASILVSDRPPDVPEPLSGTLSLIGWGVIASIARRKAA